MTSTNSLEFVRGEIGRQVQENRFTFSGTIGTGFEPMNSGNVGPWLPRVAEIVTLQSFNGLVPLDETGAIFRVEGVDQDFNIISETVTLLGAAGGETTQKFRRVELVTMIGTATDLGSNKGTIWCRSDSGEDIMRMDPCEGVMGGAHVVVPANTTGHVLKFTLTAQKSRAVEVRIQVYMGFQRDAAPFRPLVDVWRAIDVEEPFVDSLTVPLRFPPGSDLIITARASGANTAAILGGEFFLVAGG